MKIKTIASSSYGNCYHIADGETQLLLEAGISVKKIKEALDFKLSEISGCLVTHSHGDHNKHLRDLVITGIKAYGTFETLKNSNLSGLKATPVKILEKFEIGTFSIIAFETKHDCEGSCGYLIDSKETGERLLFATDTFYIKYCFENLTHIMIECNYVFDILLKNIESKNISEMLAKRLLTSHSSLENVKGFLAVTDLSKVEEIHLLHLSDSNSDEIRMKEEVEKLTGKLVFVAPKDATIKKTKILSSNFRETNKEIIAAVSGPEPELVDESDKTSLEIPQSDWDRLKKKLVDAKIYPAQRADNGLRNVVLGAVRDIPEAPQWKKSEDVNLDSIADMDLYMQIMKETERAVNSITSF